MIYTQLELMLFLSGILVVIFILFFGAKQAGFFAARVAIARSLGISPTLTQTRFSWRQSVWALALVVALVLSLALVATTSLLVRKLWMDLNSNQINTRSHCEKSAGIENETFNVTAAGTNHLLVIGAGSSAKMQTELPATMSCKKRIESDEKAAEVEGKDAIANTMTAVSTAIAAITLVLSVGTTWFANQQKLLEQKLIKVNELADRMEARQGLQDKRAALRSLALAAKQVAHVWLMRAGMAPETVPHHVSRTFLNIDALASGDRNVRFDAFMELALQMKYSDTLEPLKRYCDSCHYYHLATAAYFAASVSSHTEDVATAGKPILRNWLSEIQRLNEQGLACKIFDSDEFERVSMSGKLI
jgi:hypothetical protein